MGEKVTPVRFTIPEGMELRKAGGGFWLQDTMGGSPTDEVIESAPLTDSWFAEHLKVQRPVESDEQHRRRLERDALKRRLREQDAVERAELYAKQKERRDQEMAALLRRWQGEEIAAAGSRAKRLKEAILGG